MIGDFLSSKPVISSIVLAILFTGTMITLAIMKRRLKNDFDRKKTEANNARDVEQISLQYNKRSQMIDIARLAVCLVAVLIASMIYNIEAFSYVLVALGALILAMRETVNSLIAYVFILMHYDIGDDVRMNGSLGEIIRIKPIITSLAGKDDNGEYNGKLIHIPNYQFLLNPAERQELKTDNYRRIVIQALYNHNSFGLGFSEWLQKVKTFLDSELPQRKLEHVGNYRGFAGTKYKLSYDYDEDGEILVKISFIADPSKAGPRKEKIIAFIESLRATKKSSKLKD